MHFTKSQIEEIARRLALITKRDSELPDAEIPLDESEKVPIIQYIPLVQDYENRLLSLADLRSLVLADHDQTAIACRLNVTCNTDGATVRIKGSVRTSYIGYYGEMVDVIITAEGYDAWFGVITMTQEHTLVVSLNEHGGGPGPVVSNYQVKITNSQGAIITINGSSVASGSVNYFSSGSSVSILVSKEGYDPWSYETASIAEDIIKTITLPAQDPEERDKPYIRFGTTSVTGQPAGMLVKVQLKSNIDWVLSGLDSPVPDESEDDYNAMELPDSITVPVGGESNII